MKTIRELRRERGWTQFELALAVGVQPQTVYLWESGRRQPQVSQMRKLGEVFNMCSDDIDLGASRASFGDTPGQTGSGRNFSDGALGRDQIERALMRNANETGPRAAPSSSSPRLSRSRKDTIDGRT